MQTTTAETIAELRSTFASITSVDPASKMYRGICKLLDQCDDNALRDVFAADIKFVSKLALNRMIKRGIA